MVDLVRGFIFAWMGPMSVGAVCVAVVVIAFHCAGGQETHRAPRASPADVGVDQIRNKKLQIHACAHKRVSVFTVITHLP